jgi:putative endonuclease
MPYFVYITTNLNNTVFYTGVTRDLIKRVAEHQMKIVPGFTRRYRTDKLVFYEMYEDIVEAITREKQIKAGSRQKKIDLVRRVNQQWQDLANKL